MPEQGASPRKTAVPAVLAALVLGVAGGAAATFWLAGHAGFTSEVAATAEAATANGPCNGKPAKFYRNPMGEPDTSPVPKKDSMGMDYIPVCESEGPADPADVVKVNLDRVQRLGVRSEVVEERELERKVRAFATVQFDERRQYVVAPKFGGWIDKLEVDAVGDVVKRGETLFEVYSPELNVLQQEWSLAGRTAYAADRLRYFDYPEQAMERLRRGERPRTIAFPSPAKGTVLEKKVVAGQHFLPGDTLFRIVDTSTMWVMAEVYEQDLDYVRVGDRAKITVNAWPDRPFYGRATFIYPEVGATSRTARLRIEVANPEGLLRADMVAAVEIKSPIAGRWVAAPVSALIDSGKRKVVLVELGEGRYEPRPIKIGMRVPGYVQVLEGLKVGERVVTSANFLIDSESNIQAALAAFTAGNDK